MELREHATSQVRYDRDLPLMGYSARLVAATPRAAPAAWDPPCAANRPDAAPIPEDPLALFRRAIVDGDQGAWVALCARYNGLVRAWLRRHPAARLPDEEADYLVNRTFERFWRSVGAERFGTFEGVRALLCYLKLCAQCVSMDEAKARAKHQAVQLTGWEQVGGFEDAIAEQAGARALWEAIVAVIRDETELLVARHSFVQGLKPREIQEHYPERFATIADVYRVKRNLLERLRRDPTIRAAFTGVAVAPEKDPDHPPTTRYSLNARICTEQRGAATFSCPAPQPRVSTSRPRPAARSGDGHGDR